MRSRTVVCAYLLAVSASSGCGSSNTKSKFEKTSADCVRANDCEATGKCVDNVCQPRDNGIQNGPGSSESQDASSDTSSEWEQSSLPSDSASDAEAFSLEMIDNMESELTFSSSGFVWSRGIGNWFTTIGEDVTDSQRAILTPPRESSQRCFSVAGSRSVADMWVQLFHPNGTRVDLSAFAGVSFWARVENPDAALFLGVNASERAELVVTQDAARLIPATEQWRRFDLTFDELGSGTEIATFDFIVDGRAGDFEVWIDDLALLCAGPCP